MTRELLTTLLHENETQRARLMDALSTLDGGAEEPYVALVRAPAGKTIATVEVEIGPGSTMLLQTVIPIPPTPRDRLPRLCVAGRLASLMPVTRSARGMIDSVQLVASIAMPAGPIGSLVRLPIQVSGSTATPEVFPMPILPSLIVQVELTDGRVLYADLMASRKVRQLRSCPHLKESVFFAILADPAGYASHLTAHAYLTMRADGLIECNLRLAEAYLAYAQRTLPGDVYYKSASVTVQGRRIVVPFPTATCQVEVRQDGSKYTLLGKTEANHLWLRQQACERRFIIADEKADDAVARSVGEFYGHGFVVEGEFSWQTIPSHGALKGTPGAWTGAFNLWGTSYGRDAIRVNAQKEAWALRSAVSKGVPDESARLYQHAFGLFQPSGREEQGEPGGWQVTPIVAHRLCREALVAAWLWHKGLIDRQAEFHYDVNGEPTTAVQWAARNHGLVPFDFRCNGNMTFPKLRYGRKDGMIDRKPNIAWNLPVPVAYEDLMRAYEPQDNAHGRRKTQFAETLALLTNSGIAREDIWLFAENAMLNYHAFPHRREFDAGCTIAAAKEAVDVAPHTGVGIAGRDAAWAFQVIATHYTLASQAWRTQYREWFSVLAEVFVEGATPLGFHCVHVGDRVVDDAIAAGAPAGYAYTQCFEEQLFAYAALSCARAALDDGNGQEQYAAVRKAVMQLADTLLFPPYQRNGQHVWFAAIGPVGERPFATPQPHMSTNKWEALHLWYLAYCAAISLEPAGLTASNKYLKHALSLGEGYANGDELIFRQQSLAKEYWHDVSDYASYLWGAFGMVKVAR